MEKRDDERKILFRYFLLSNIFGIIIGVRYTLDIWVFEHFAPHSNDKFLLITLTFVGMLAGEILSSRLSDRVSRRVAIDSAGISLAGWAFTVYLSIIFFDSAWFYLAAICFGMGLGLFHASLDAWVDEALSITTGNRAKDSYLVQGYLFYNIGYLIGASLAFPALLGFQWTTKLPQGLSSINLLQPIPYFVTMLLSMLILLFHPASSKEQFLGSHDPDPMQSPPIRTLISDYLRILVFGKYKLIGIVLVGSCVATLIQYIDHLAPAGLVLGHTVFEKTVNLFLFNSTVCFCLAALAAYLKHLRPVSSLHPAIRAAIISGGLFFVGALITLVAYFLSSFGTKDQFALMFAALSLGLAQAVLLMLPPLIKAWVLDFAINGLRATVLSVLGISKRLFAIISTVAIFTVSWSGNLPKSGETNIYLILISFVGLSLGLTIILGVVSLYRKG